MAKSIYLKKTKHHVVIQVFKSDPTFVLSVVQDPHPISNRYREPTIQMVLPRETSVNSLRQMEIAIGQAIKDAQAMRKYTGKLEHG